ncbi:MAG: hypothetical protein H7Y37_04885 [Anaerolineae bacterium]|nr:hypothetical protein [Gloeobacterales cyanobacterium ES-bin-313]
MGVLGDIADFAGDAAEWVGDEVAGVAEVAYEAGSGVVNVVQGDWEDAAEDFGQMGTKAADVALGGKLEDAMDFLGIEQGSIDGALKSTGEWLGGKVYDLVHDEE